MRALAALLKVAATAATASAGPCDILTAAGNPCVAAHSTTRALYEAYGGPLYEVTRAADNATFAVPVLAPGGFANKSAHDDFCPALDCVISVIFDQSPQGNHLKQRHKLVNASQHPISVGGGVPVYGMYFDPGYGYHVDQTSGIATGNDPESIFAVMSGTHYNGACCFDYGNSETDNTSDGAGAMASAATAGQFPSRPAATHRPLTPFAAIRTRRKRFTSATLTGRATQGPAKGRGWARTVSEDGGRDGGIHN